MQERSKSPAAFTLIELLIVIIIIVILMAFLFPAFRGVQNQAKKAQAKNDLTQIVTAVNAFYTEYGKYPLVIADTIYGPAGNTNDVLFNELRATSATQNTRQIVFISPPDVKNATQPKAGIATQTVTVNGVSIPKGSFVDPWGTAYYVEIDGDYNNSLANPYSQNAGATPNLQIGVIAWSLGADGAGGSGDKNTGTSADDVISWQ